MGFITKNANILLLFLILISSIALVFSTVFFQSNFDKINKEYTDKMSELQKASSELNTTLQILQNYRQELALKSEREKEFSEQYTVVESEKKKIVSEKEQLATEKQTIESQLNSAKADLTKALNDLASKTTLAANLEDDLTECEADRDDYKAQRDAKENDLNDCLADLASCNCT